jgi:hypothetical protein
MHIRNSMGGDSREYTAAAERSRPGWLAKAEEEEALPGTP